MRRITGLAIALAAVIVLVPSVATAQNPQTGDYASGFGFWKADDPGDEPPGSIGFEAIGTLDAAEGEFDYRQQSNGNGFHALVECLDVQSEDEAKIAIIRIRIEESTHSDYEEDQRFLAYAQDNSNGQSDQFDLKPPGSGLGLNEFVFISSCGGAVFDEDDINGDIYLANEGMFAEF